MTRPPKPGKHTIRPGLWRPGVVILSSVLTAACTAAAVHQPGAAAVLFGCLALVFLMAWASTLPARLEITETTVRVKVGARDKQVPRSEIRAIHYRMDRISFRGADDVPITEPRRQWTYRQMLKVATEIGVPFYDHRGALGLGELPQGRLVYDPASNACL